MDEAEARGAALRRAALPALASGCSRHDLIVLPLVVAGEDAEAEPVADACAIG